MQFTFDAKSAKKLARTLEKALAGRGIELERGQAMDIIAAMQGHSSWNSLAAALTPAAIDARLNDFEHTHLQDSNGLEYGEEVELRTHSGFALRYDAQSEFCDYVRTVDPLGREVAYWTGDEWREDPGLVMGAILGSLVRGKPLAVEATRPSKKPRASAELLRRLVREALGYEAEAFENDWNVSGSDLVEWFGNWRKRVTTALTDMAPENPMLATASNSSIRLAAPVTLYVRAFACEEYGEAPNWARIVVTPELLTRLMQLRHVVHTTTVNCISDWGDPDLWSSERESLQANHKDAQDFMDDEKPREMDHGFLYVSATRFWYRTRPKHANYNVETCAINFEALLAALEGPEQATDERYQRFGEVIVYAWKDDAVCGSRVGFIEELLAHGARIPGHEQTQQ